MRISTVLFDADGVLQFPGPIYAHFEEAYGWSQERLRELFHHLFHERPDLDGGLTGDRDLAHAMGVALADRGWAERPEVFMRDWLRLGAVPDPTALELVARLRAGGVRCGVATNQPGVRGRYMHENLGYKDRFDHHFYSYEVGYAKPDPAYFAAVLARLAVPADTVLFIDDQAANVEAARSCGLHAAVHRPGDRLRDHLARYALGA